MPAGIDGLSLVDLLEHGRGPGGAAHAVSQRPFLYREFAGYGGQQCVFSGRWKAIRQQLRNGPAATELYDLKDDPSESHDLSAEHPEIVQRLEVLMSREHAESPVFPLTGLGDTTAN